MEVDEVEDENMEVYEVEDENKENSGNLNLEIHSPMTSCC